MRRSLNFIFYLNPLLKRADQPESVKTINQEGDVNGKKMKQYKS